MASPAAFVNKVHERIPLLDWDPQYAERPERYPTAYRFPKKSSKDPMKQILHSYFPMQAEKDTRVFGGLDAALRGNMFQKLSPRYTEYLKPFLSVFPFIELQAAHAMSNLIDAVDAPELHNGYVHQMIDEFRHANIQQNLARYYMEHYVDPWGFNNNNLMNVTTPVGAIGRQFAEAFTAGDAVTGSSIFLQVVGETAFTNVLFVANPSEAAANGDIALPSVFLSVQSDEARHINNGFATLALALENPDNHRLIERDLRYAFWILHTAVDGIMSVILEYGDESRRPDKPAYYELWKRWVYDDYYRTYLLPLEKYGIRIPSDLVQEIWDRLTVKDWHHKMAIELSAMWMFNSWRFEPLNERDFEWFEKKYPGWYSKYGTYWENYRRLSVPGPGQSPPCLAGIGHVLPYTCYTCLEPVAIREELQIAEHNGRVYTYCSDACRWVHETTLNDPVPMVRLAPPEARMFTEIHAGQSLEEALRSSGLVRSDGQTLVAQPHLLFDDKYMWRLEHLPNIELSSQLDALTRMTPEERARAVDEYRKGITFH